MDTYEDLRMVKYKVVPYDTGKVKIGSLYAPPPRPVEMGLHAEWLQLALLHKPMTIRDKFNMWLRGGRAL